LDMLAVTVGIISFCVCLLIQVISFRWLRPEEVLKSMLLCVIAIVVLPMALMGILFSTKAIEASFLGWVMASLLASLITVLLSFVYILCIFGPYETSVRLRLLREIAKGKDKGVSWEEISSQYNVEIMTNIRLQRLVRSGDVIEKDGLYQVGSNKNFYFIFDAIAGVIKKWIG